MALVYPIRPTAWDEFDDKFRLAMGRAMTGEESKWLRLSDLVLTNDADPEDEVEQSLNAG